MVFLGSIAVNTVQAFMKEFEAANCNPKYFIASSGPDQGSSFLSAVGTGPAVGAMVPNGWSGDYPNALSHVMVQDYIAKYGGTASDINADVAEAYSAGQVEAAAVTATRLAEPAEIIDWLHSHTGADGARAGHVRQQREEHRHRELGADLPVAAGPGRLGRAQFVQVLPNGHRPPSSSHPRGPGRPEQHGPRREAAAQVNGAAN